MQSGNRPPVLEGRLPGPLLKERLHGRLEVLRGEQPRELGGRDLVGAVHAALAVGADDPLRRGVCPRRAGREALREAHPLLVDRPVVDHPVDDAPALEDLRVVEAARHHELARAAWPGPLGHPLCAARSGREPHDRLDQPELRRALGPDDVAAKGDLQARREAHSVNQGERRDLERLEATDAIDQRLREVARGLRPGVEDGLEVRDVDPSGEDVALGPPDERPGVRALDLPDAVDELGKGRRREEVVRRVLEGDDRDVTVSAEGDGLAQVAPRIWSATAAICSGSAPRGIHGSFSGSST